MSKESFSSLKYPQKRKRIIQYLGFRKQFLFVATECV